MHTTQTPADLWKTADRLSQRAAGLTAGRIPEPRGMWPGQCGPGACIRLAAEFRVKAVLGVLGAESFDRWGEWHIRTPHQYSLFPACDNTGVGMLTQNGVEWSVRYEVSLSGTVGAVRGMLVQAARACRVQAASGGKEPCPACVRWAAELDGWNMPTGV